MLSKSIGKLYKVKEAMSLWVFLILAGVVSISGALANYFDSFIARNFVFALMTVLPFSITLCYKKKSEYRLLPSIITKEIYFLFIVFVIIGLDYLLFYEPIHFTDIPDKEIFFIMVINLTVIAMYISYIIEENIIKLQEIDEQNKLLNDTLEAVKHVSEHDQLTGLYNRRKINETLENYHKKSDQRSHGYQILIGDINNFKMINDTYWHQFGDEVIKYVANALILTVKQGAVVGRWGGDEYIVVCENKTDKDAKAFKAQINTYFETHHINKVKISMSMGFSEYKKGASINDIIHLADQRMYEEKNNRKI